jgi:hypothetical protein
MVTPGATVNFTNAVIAGNQATYGGGVYASGGTSPSFINVTFADNQATGANGGGAFYFNSTSATIRNSIFWNNTAPSGNGKNLKRNASGSCGTLTDSDVTTGAGWTDNCTLTTGNNIDPALDPIFTGGTPYDYHIQSGSPVIDRANAVYAPADDIDGQSRPLGIADDMGADEKE